MSQSVRFVPVSMFGAAMGICGLALVTRNAAGVIGAPTWLAEVWALIGIATFIALAIAYGAKLLQHRDAVRAELANPAMMGFFGSIPIALALAAGCLGAYSIDLARMLWWIAVIGIVFVQVYVMSRWLAGGIDLAQVNTGWMIAFIGPVPIAGPGLLVGEFEAARVLFGISAAATPFVVGLVFFRTVVGPTLPDAMKPTTFIFLVPIALIYAYGGPLWALGPNVAIEALFYFGLVLAAALLVFARGAARWPFGPAWWAFTFPLDSLAIAALVYAKAHPNSISLAIAWICFVIATAMVLVVLVRTVQHFASGALFAAPKPA